MILLFSLIKITGAKVKEELFDPFDHLMRFAYPPTSLVIVQVHQLSAMVVSAASHAHLSFSDVNEILGKLVAVMDVISTASPYPFLLEIFGATSLGTSAGCKLAVAAASGDAVHDPSGSYGISESSLFRCCNKVGKSSKIQFLSGLAKYLSTYG